MTTETLTESFCERCGTRYEFSAPTRLNPLRKTRGLIGGLKNWVTSQDDLSDAINDAMRDEEGALASAQLSAFHEAFNFCIDCRQYTCLSCWNDAAGRCRTCVPIPGQDDLAERIAASAAGLPMPSIAEATDAKLGQHVAAEAWPTHDLPPDAVAATNGHADDDAWATTPGAWAGTPPAVPTTEPPASVAGGGFVGVDGFVYETQEQADAVAAQLERAQAEAEAEALAVAQAEEVALAAEQAESATLAAEQAESATIAAERPDSATLAGEPLEIEPVLAEAATVEDSAPEPRLRVVAWEEDVTSEAQEQAASSAPLPEPPAEVPVAADADSEPVAAEVPPAVEPEPEPVAAAEPPPAPEAPTPRIPRIAPITETILRFPARPAAEAPAQPLAAEDESPEAAARRAQLDSLGLGDPGDGPLPPDRQVLPYRSRGASISPAELAMRAAAGQRFWEASAREVASAVGNIGVQNCAECGLSLSANARFCRRCGTRQAQPA